ncbi:cell division control protein [Pelomyxa schiedti]|nr:cell division control protein [Pelomyxa schiedti]
MTTDPCKAQHAVPAMVSVHRTAQSSLSQPQTNSCSPLEGDGSTNLDSASNTNHTNSENPDEKMGVPQNGAELGKSTDILRTSSPSLNPESPDRLDKSVVEQNGLVKLATVDGLVARLTSETYAEDPHLMLHFLLTHNGHTPPTRLLELLIARYNLQPKSPPADMDLWIKNVLTPIRLRVFNVLRTWIERLWNSSTQPELITRVRDFLTEASSVMKNPAERVLYSLNRAITGEEAKKQIVFDRSPPISLLPLDMALGQKYTAASFSVHNLHMKEIARQMTLIEQSIYCAIKPWELIGLAWTKKEKTLAPNVSKMIQHFNRISKWVFEEVTAADNLPSRIRILERFIELADYLEQLQNYNALMEIIAGLTNSIVFRLKKTWGGISQWHSHVFEACKHLMETTKNNARLRQKLHTIYPPCIPYLGIYLTDLTFIEEGNSTMIEDKVNFYKCRLQANVILEVQQYQQAPYCLENVPLLAEWILSQGNASTEELCYQKSCLLEPKEPSLEEPQADTTPPLPLSNDVQLLLLYPGELEPSQVTVCQTLTIGEVMRSVLDRWAKTSQNPNSYTKHFLDNMSKVSFSLIAPTSRTQPGFMVADCQLLSDLLMSQPNFSKKGGNYFAILTSQTFVSTAFVSSDTCTTAVTVIDGNAPLLLMEPLFSTAFETTSELVFLFYEAGSLVKWLNGNLSYNAHKLPSNGLLIVMPLDQVVRPDTEEQIRNRTQILHSTEGALCGYMNKFEARFHSYTFKPVQVELQPRVRKTQAFTKEKRRWLVAIDSFLLYYSDIQSPAPKRVMALQAYDVLLVRDNSQLCIMLKRNVQRTKEEKPFVIAAPQEEQTRQWFAVLYTKSRVNERTRQFGVEMKVIASRPGQKLVPPVMCEVLNFLYLRAVANDKLFSQEGNHMILEKLKSQFDSGQSLDPFFTDYITLGEVVKLYLAELPEPLLTTSLYPKFAKIGEMTLSHANAVGETEVLALKTLVQQLPSPNSAVLTYVLAFLRYWSCESGLDIPKVAAIFGPYLLRPTVDTDSHTPPDTPGLITCITVLLLKFQDKICKMESEMVPAFQETIAREVRTEPESIHILSTDFQNDIVTMVKEAQVTGHSKKIRARSSSSHAKPVPPDEPASDGAASTNSPTVTKSVKRSSQDGDNGASLTKSTTSSDSSTHALDKGTVSASNDPSHNNTTKPVSNPLLAPPNTSKAGTTSSTTLQTSSPAVVRKNTTVSSPQPSIPVRKVASVSSPPPTTNPPRPVPVATVSHPPVNAISTRSNTPPTTTNANTTNPRDANTAGNTGTNTNTTNSRNNRSPSPSPTLNHNITSPLSQPGKH